MVCQHLEALEQALLQAGAKETYRGQAWSRNCREWVYFDVALDVETIRTRFALGDEVETHENTDPRSGLEAGLVCSLCQDAVMGNPGSTRRFPGLAD